MAFFFQNRYPYTDFHELNLDWIISKIKEIKDSVIAAAASEEAAAGSAEAAARSAEAAASSAEEAERLLQDGGITTAKLADEAVTTGKLADGAVTTPKLAAGLQLLMNKTLDSAEPVILREYSMHSRYSAQGMAFDGTYFYIGVPAGWQDGTDFPKIVKYDRAGNEVASLDAPDNTSYIFHCNGMGVDVDSGVLYSADCLDYGERGTATATYLNTITVVDTSDMSYVKTLTMPATVNGCTGVCWYNNRLYALDNSGELWIVNTSNGNVTHNCTLEMQNSGVSQAVYIDDDFIYFVKSGPNHLELYSHAGEFVKNVNIGMDLKGTFLVGELESIAIDDKCLYICYNNGPALYSCVSKVDIGDGANDTYNSMTSAEVTIETGLYDLDNKVFPSYASANSFSGISDSKNSFNVVTLASSYDADDMIGPTYGYGVDVMNGPSDTPATGFLAYFPHATNENYGKEFYLPYNKNDLFVRTKNAGTYSDWTAIPLLSELANIRIIPFTATSPAAVNSNTTITIAGFNGAKERIVGAIAVAKSKGNQVWYQTGPEGSTGLSVYAQANAVRIFSYSNTTTNYLSTDVQGIAFIVPVSIF